MDAYKSIIREQSFKNDYSEKFKNVPDQAYRFKKIFFYISDSDSKRDKCLELKGCCICCKRKKYFHTICNLAIEVTSISNVRFVIWVRVPCNYNYSTS